MPELLTVIVFVVAPVLHLILPEQPLAVSVALSLAHKLFLFVLMTGVVGTVPVLITTALLAPLSPQAFIQLAVYVPELLTVIVLVVVPVLHLILPEQPLAVIVALSPLHKLFLFVLITVVVGAVPVLITTALLAPLSPQAFIQLAV